MINTDRSALYRLDMLNEQHLKVNYQMSTGKKIDQGSDDSKVYTQDLHINDRVRTYEGLKVQLEKNNAQNDVSDSTLNEIKNILDFIKTETIKARNDTNDDVSRNAIATQIEGAKENLYTLVNERVEDEYIFSGSQTNVQAFVKDETGKISYNGNPNLRLAAVEEDSYRERGVTGFDIMAYDVGVAVDNQELTFKEGERIIDEQGREWKLNDANTVLVQYDEDGKATKNYVEVETEEQTQSDGSTKLVHTVADIGTNEDESQRVFTVKRNTFDALDDLINALRNNDGDEISFGLEEMSNAYDAANEAHGQLGGRNATFEIAYERVTAKITHFNVLDVQNNSADLAKVAMEAKQLELTYTSLYSTISKMNNLTLANYVN